MRFGRSVRVRVESQGWGGGGRDFLKRFIRTARCFTMTDRVKFIQAVVTKTTTKQRGHYVSDARTETCCMTTISFQQNYAEMFTTRYEIQLHNV